MAKFTVQSWFRNITFHWLDPLIKVARRRDVKENDISEVVDFRAIDPCVESTLSTKGFGSSNAAPRPLFWLILLKVCRRDFLVGGILRLLGDLSEVFAPFILRFFLTAIREAQLSRSERDQTEVRRCIIFGICIILLLLCQTLCANHSAYRGMIIGIQARSMLMSLVFAAALRPIGISQAAPNCGVVKNSDLYSWDSSTLLHLATTTTLRVEYGCPLFHVTWTAPVAIVVAVGLLSRNLGPSALAGAGFLVISVPVLAIISKKIASLRRQTTLLTSQRTGLTREVLQIVRGIKLLSWEQVFITRLSKERSEEANMLERMLTLKNVVNALSMSLPLLASVISFIVYARLGGELDAARIFSSLALFNSLRMPLLLLPVVVMQVVEAVSSCNRLQIFLQSRQSDSDNSNLIDPQQELAISMVDASFVWDRGSIQSTTNNKRDTEKCKSHTLAASKVHENASLKSFPESVALQNLNLNAEMNSLIAVIGDVGSGKTALLEALAGDMIRVQGTLSLAAFPAYCPETPWIQNATARENIIFGLPFDSNWYNIVLDACALWDDVVAWPQKDQTNMGELGSLLSGGQKRRIGLARAIYCRSQIALLDNPLSGLDIKVAQHVFTYVIKGLLRDRCCVLVTQEVAVARQCDKVLWIDHGMIKAFDTPEAVFERYHELEGMLHSWINVGAESKQSVTLTENDCGDNDFINRLNDREESFNMNTYELRQCLRWLRDPKCSLFLVLSLCFLITGQAANITSMLWLSWWTSGKYQFATYMWMVILAALAVGQMMLIFTFSDVLSRAIVQATTKIIGAATSSVLRGQIVEIEAIPVGHLLEKFSRDVDVLDTSFIDASRMGFILASMILCALGLGVYFLHYVRLSLARTPFSSSSINILLVSHIQQFAIVIIPFVTTFVLIAAYYKSSAQRIKHAEDRLRADLNADLSEFLQGASIIRTSNQQCWFQARIDHKINKLGITRFLGFALQRWLSVRLDTVGIFLNAVVLALAVAFRHSSGPSKLGLVLSYMLSITQMLQSIVKQVTDIDIGLRAVQRIESLCANFTNDSSKPYLQKPGPESHFEGRVCFDQVDLTYGHNSPVVVKNFSAVIRPGEHIAIVGRTGAGKSTILSAMVKMASTRSGCISVDGSDLRDMSLDLLLSHIAIVPQHPVFFKGTVRYNLDPREEYHDEVLLDVLRKCQLTSNQHTATSCVERELTLETCIDSGGENLSMGQRQLLALSRVLLSRASIVLLDEPSSALNDTTESLVQELVTSIFGNVTVICVAHHLRAVLHYNRILVMNEGLLVEDGKPVELFQRGRLFKAMCDLSGVGLDDICRHMKAND